MIVVVITVTRLAFHSVSSLHCRDRHTRSEERAIWYPLTGTKLKTAIWISDQLASPLFESAARVRDDVAIITVTRLAFHSVSSLNCRDRHTRSEERAIWYSLPGIPIKNCNMDLGSIGFAALRVRCAGPR